MPELRRLRAASLTNTSGTAVEVLHEASEPVRRSHGGTIDIEGADDLFQAIDLRRATDSWSRDRAICDRWIAPRLHHALRLTRREAADRATWTWLALRHRDFVVWRWRDVNGEVASDRWSGPIHKQSLARLWWGAELFRNGDDYEPVERAFVLQDLPNSYLHRPVVRCRSLALGLVNALVPCEGTERPSSVSVNDLARTLNLITTGSPPELETGLQQDDRVAYLSWVNEGSTAPESWEALPKGPTAADTTPESVAAGEVLALRGVASVNRRATRTPDRSNQDEER